MKMYGVCRCGSEDIVGSSGDYDYCEDCMNRVASLLAELMDSLNIKRDSCVEDFKKRIGYEISS